MDELIIKYISKTATDSEKEQLLAWLKADEKNLLFFRQTQNLWDTTTIALMPEEEIRYKLNELKGKMASYENRKWRKYQFMRIAAAIVFILTIAGGSFYLGQGFAPSAMREAIVMNQVVMGKGNRGSVTLPDGTIAWLNSGSKLIYPETFNTDYRQVKLEGEGYFEVKRNEKAPFYVETESMIVNVLGTVFDVQSYAQKDITETVLLSGKVEVTLKANNKKIELQPGQKISYNKQTKDFLLEKVDASEYGIWINEQLLFDSEKLSTVLRKLERWYGIRITAASTLPLDQRLTLTIRYEPKEEILKMLSLIVPMQYSIEEDQVFIK